MPEEESQVPQIRTSPMQNPMSALGSTVYLMTKPDNSLFELELSLRGLRQNDDGTLLSFDKPKMNEEGISNVIGLLCRCIINQNTVMSNISENLVRANCLVIAGELRKHLMLNRARYDINMGDETIIFFSVMSYIHMTMRRPIDEGERRWTKGSVQEIRSSVDTGQQKRGLGKLFGW